MIADDHPLFRDALRGTVTNVVESAAIAEAGTFDELTRMLEQDGDVDLVLLDLSMPGVRGLSGLIYLRTQYPACPVVIVSASDDAETIRRSMDFGASGFISKRSASTTCARPSSGCWAAASGRRRTSTSPAAPTPRRRR